MRHISPKINSLSHHTHHKQSHNPLDTQTNNTENKTVADRFPLSKQYCPVPKLTDNIAPNQDKSSSSRCHDIAAMTQSPCDIVIVPHVLPPLGTAHH